MILSSCQTTSIGILVMPLKYVIIQGHNVQTFLPVGVTKKSVSQRIIHHQDENSCQVTLWGESSLLK